MLTSSLRCVGMERIRPGPMARSMTSLWRSEPFTRETSRAHVLVKSQGNFEKLLIIRIDRELNFQAKLFDKSESKGRETYERSPVRLSPHLKFTR